MPETISFLIIFPFVVGLTAVEAWLPDQNLPRTRLWWARVLLLLGLTTAIMLKCAGFLKGKLLPWHLFEGTHYFSPLTGGVVSYLFGTLVFYGWHRVRHESNLLWRLCHQIHHSPTRIQAVTAFYVHPVEALASSMVNSFVVLVLFGLPAESLTWNSTIASLVGIFYHMNLSTPRWVGYFLQRPEMHRVHHEIGVHRYNYADLPIWDMLFGTYRNPARFTGECGYGGNRELRLGSMLLFQDVNQE